MSKKLLASLAVLLALSLAACGGNPPDDTTAPADTAPAADPAAPTTTPPADPAAPPAN